MRIYDETKTLPMPRPKTVVIPARRPTANDSFAEATARPRVEAIEAPKADRPGADSSLRKHASAGGATALAATAEPIAGKPGASAFIATTVAIKAMLDPARFFKLSQDFTDERFSVTTTDKALLRATLDPQAAQKARAKIEQYGGPGHVTVILHGRLGPNNAVHKPNLVVNPKPQKS